jgi:hypothetical protein
VPVAFTPPARTRSGGRHLALFPGGSERRLFTLDEGKGPACPDLVGDPVGSSDITALPHARHL